MAPCARALEVTSRIQASEQSNDYEPIDKMQIHLLRDSPIKQVIKLLDQNLVFPSVWPLQRFAGLSEFNDAYKLRNALV